MRRPTRTGGIRFATRKSSRIAYDPGPAAGAEAEKSTVVILHALLTDHTEFIPLRDLLTDQYRVVLPDARGHGASPTLQNQWYSVAELANDVIAVLDAERAGSTHIVGHDLGGTIAIEVARRYPARVCTLTLIEPELGSVLDNDASDEIRAARAERRASDRKAGDAAYKQLVDRSLDGFLNDRWGRDWRSSISKPRMGAIRRHAPALAGILPALDSYQMNRQDLGAIMVPTEIIVGEDAGMIERATAERLANWIPGADLRSLPLESRAAGVVRDDLAAPLAQSLVEFWSSQEVE